MIRLEEILYYYQMRRGSGHTNAVIEGAKNIGKCIYLTASREEARLLGRKYPNIRTVDIHNDNALRGLDLPLIIDHHVLALLIREYDMDKVELIQELHRLKSRIKELEKENCV